jgi:G:T/U-mismatch repair DNA glycosylase
VKKIYRKSDIHTFCNFNHPYKPFNIKDADTIIIGNTPPSRFSTKELQDGDVDWYYGSRYNAFWSLLEISCEVKSPLITKEDRKNFFLNNGIGIFDTIKRCSRSKGCGASDGDLYNIELIDVLSLLKQNKHKKIALFFSSRFVAELFQKATNTKFDLRSRQMQEVSLIDKTLELTILYSPSPSWARGLSEEMRKNPNKNEIRLEQYSKICKNKPKKL